MFLSSHAWEFSLSHFPNAYGQNVCNTQFVSTPFWWILEFDGQSATTNMFETIFLKEKPYETYFLYFSIYVYSCGCVCEIYPPNHSYSKMGSKHISCIMHSYNFIHDFWPFILTTSSIGAGSCLDWKQVRMLQFAPNSVPYPLSNTNVQRHLFLQGKNERLNNLVKADARTVWAFGEQQCFHSADLPAFIPRFAKFTAWVSGGKRTIFRTVRRVSSE